MDSWAPAVNKRRGCGEAGIPNSNFQNVCRVVWGRKTGPTVMDRVTSEAWRLNTGKRGFMKLRNKALPIRERGAGRRANAGKRAGALALVVLGLAGITKRTKMLRSGLHQVAIGACGMPATSSFCTI